MKIFYKISELRNFISDSKKQGKTIAFVPTMGALHAGHVSLVDYAKNHAELVGVSIFVNPTQFGKNEDFGKYPRTLEADIEILENANVDFLFAPSAEEIYPPTLSGKDENAEDIKLGEYAKVLCGKFRTGHFEGVVQVVKKLFEIVKPDVAVFGEKDFQQVFVLKTMLGDMTKIITAPTLREEDGLAMSSRNRYLDIHGRKMAGMINIVMREALIKFSHGDIATDILTDAQIKLASSGIDEVQYLEFRESDSLKLSDKFTDNTRIFFAGFVGSTRLIDNIGG